MEGIVLSPGGAIGWAIRKTLFSIPANGAELLDLGGLRAVGAHHRGGGGDLAVDLGFGFKDAETELLTDEAAFDHELVAGLHDALEAGVVDAGGPRLQGDGQEP